MTTVADPQVLLRWMRARRGDIPARAISDAGPRHFRRRAAADMALAVLIDAGALIEVSSRPRAFRVVQSVLPERHHVLSQIATKSGRRDLPDLLDAAAARQRASGRSEAAALVLAAAEVRDAMRRDPQHAPEPVEVGRCQHCGGKLEGDHAVLLHGVCTHLTCVLKYRNAVDHRLDGLIADALDGGLFATCSVVYDVGERT